MPDLSKFAVVTTYFNPIGYQNRYDLYKRFEQHMIDSGVFLLTIECIFDSAPIFGLPKQDFSVTLPNKRRHIQINAPTILWIKENLINIAVERLPSNVEYIAWIDADIEFEQSDWPHIIIRELEKFPIVQIFEVAHFLGPNGKREVLRIDYSFGYSIRHGKPIDPRKYKEWYPHPGYGWAMRRSAFVSMGGLFEYSIVGSGDSHFVYALLNRVDETIPKTLTDDYRQHLHQWAQRVTRVANRGHDVSYAPLKIYHYWHGSREDRAYVSRWDILGRHTYQPSNDIERNSQTGIISLANRRQTDRLQMSVRMIAIERDIVAYFKQRHEDNVPSQTQPAQPSLAAKPAKKTEEKVKQISKNVVKESKNIIRSHASTIKTGSTNVIRPSKFSTPIWSSGPSGTHVDYDHSQWIDCTCQHQQHCHHEEDCPCSTHYHHHSSDSCSSSDHEHDHHQEHEYQHNFGIEYPDPNPCETQGPDQGTDNSFEPGSFY